MNRLIKLQNACARFLVASVLFYSLLPHLALAAQDKPMGELSATGAVSINGAPAANGATVARGSKIQTGEDGSATVNLNRLGNITVKLKSDFLLDYQENAIRGNLEIGTIEQTIGSGVAVNINTPNGEVAIPAGQTPAKLTVIVTPESTQAIVRQEEGLARSFRPFEPSQTRPRNQIAGELWADGGVTVNDKPATTGMTILRGSRIQTAADGSAVVNLSRLGRLALQRETKLLSDFQENSISGSLETGSILQNLPSGIATNIVTPHGGYSIPQSTPRYTLTVSVVGSEMSAFARRDNDQRPAGACGRELSRAFIPSQPTPGWLVPLLFVAGGALVATITAITITGNPNIPIVVVPPEVTGTNP